MALVFKYGTIQTPDASPHTLVDVKPPDNTIRAYTMWVTAQNGTSNGGVFQVQGGYRSKAGSVTLVGTPVVTSWQEGTSWAVSLGVTNNRLRLTVTGQAATNINWTLVQADFVGLPSPPP